MKQMFWMLEILCTFVEMYIGFQFIAIVFEKKARRTTVLYAFLIATTVGIINYRYGLFTDYTLYVSTFLVIITSACLYQIKIRMALGAVFFYMIDILALIDVSCIIGAGIFTSNESFGQIYTQEFSLTRVFLIFICKGILCLCFLLIRNIVREHSVKWLFTDYWLIMLLIGLLSFFGFSSLNTFLFANLTAHITERWFFLIALISLGYLMMMLYYNYRITMDKRDRIEMRMKVLESDYNSLKQITDIEKKSSHDFKNHLNMLHKYLKEENQQAALDYVLALREPLQEPGQRIWTGNEIMDFILNVKMAEAKRQGIDFNIDTKLYDFSMNERDLNCILSNILDNAIEASVEALDKRRIDVYIHTKNETLIIKIKNFHQNHIVKKGKKLITSKADKRRHGLGLTIVKKTLEKYDGYLNIEYNQDTFQVLITIPMP